MALPRDVQEGIARGVAAYVRATEVAELPGPLRRFKGFTDRGIRSQANALVSSLADPGLRARVVEWLDDKPRRLAGRDQELLRIACERSDGWEGRLIASTQSSAKPAVTAETSSVALDLERQREKARKARQEARAAKEEASRSLEEQRARTMDLVDELRDVRERLAAAEREAAEARKVVAAAEERFDRELRKARRDTAKAIAQQERHKEKERAARKEAAALRRELESSRTKRSPSRVSQRTEAPAPPTRRKRLRAPLGRMDDDPETLSEWLDTESVRLVIDGYNVTKAEGGFSELTLEGQRERLVDAVTRLTRRRKVPETIIVFDGSEAPPAAGRRGRGKVRVEYSAVDVIADDHIAALVKSLPAYPVVVVTNDRELQSRVARLAATVARSDQLLALFR